MRIMLVDDEQPSLDELEYLLGKHKDINIAGSFTKPQEAFKSIMLSIPDAVFLDIEMPNMNGLELAEKIHNLRATVTVIFVTAYGKRLAEAKNASPTEFLMKPVSEAKLGAILEKIRQKGNA